MVSLASLSHAGCPLQNRPIAVMPATGQNVQELRPLMLPQCPAEGDRVASESIPLGFWEGLVLSTVFSWRCAASGDLVGPHPHAYIALVQGSQQGVMLPTSYRPGTFGDVWRQSGLSQLAGRGGLVTGM